MGNTKIVPKKLRFKLYKKAYDDLINNKELVGLTQPIGLCVSLPIYLWNLKSIDELAPNGEEWITEDTPKMFPELEQELYDLDVPKNAFMYSWDRIAFLEKVLNIKK
jgi:hypothetical protein